MENFDESIKKLSFEDALAKLEKTVAALQSGNAPLDKSLQLFKEGTALVKYCTELLDNARQEVLKLTAAPDGSFIREDFDVQ